MNIMKYVGSRLTSKTTITVKYKNTHYRHDDTFQNIHTERKKNHAINIKIKRFGIIAMRQLSTINSTYVLILSS